MSTKPEILEAAKKGDPKVIAALLNQFLKPKGITVKAFIQSNRLNIFLEAAQVPPQPPLMNVIEKGLTNLGIQNIKTVKVHGKQTGNDLPSWVEEFTLDSYIEYIEPQIEHTSAIITPIKPVQTLAIKKLYQRPIIGLSALAGLAVFASFGLGGSIFWLRSTQNSAIATAQELSKTVNLNESIADLQILKTNQKNLQEAITNLEKTPKFLWFNVNTLQTELDQTQEVLVAVEERIKDYEAIIPKIEAVVDQFSALNSSLDVGMNYRDYTSEIRQLKVAIDRLGREPGISNYMSYNDLEAAYEHYEFAYKVWQYYIESKERHDFFPASSFYGRQLVSEYNVTPHNIVNRDYIYLDNALSTIWSAASQKIQDAQAKS